MPGRTRQALHNTMIQAGSQVLTWALSWVLLVLLPRYLGDDGFGKLFFAISYGTIFSTLINLGVNTYLTKQVAVFREGKDGGGAVAELIANAFGLKLSLAVIVYLLQAGLIYLLLRVYSGHSAREILDAEPRFVRELGLGEHLSPTRANGLNAMLEAIRGHARAVLA